jgi:hypothetical protein
MTHVHLNLTEIPISVDHIRVLSKYMKLCKIKTITLDFDKMLPYYDMLETLLYVKHRYTKKDIIDIMSNLSNNFELIVYFRPEINKDINTTKFKQTMHLIKHYQGIYIHNDKTINIDKLRKKYNTHVVNVPTNYLPHVNLLNFSLLLKVDVEEHKHMRIKDLDALPLVLHHSYIDMILEHKNKTLIEMMNKKIDDSEMILCNYIYGPCMIKKGTIALGYGSSIYEAKNDILTHNNQTCLFDTNITDLFYDYNDHIYVKTNSELYRVGMNLEKKTLVYSNVSNAINIAIYHDKIFILFADKIVCNTEIIKKIPMGQSRFIAHDGVDTLYVPIGNELYMYTNNVFKCISKNKWIDCQDMIVCGNNLYARFKNVVKCFAII